MTVLFRVAAGPRTGFGHLRRALTLASALGVRARIALRAGPKAAAAARSLGATLEPGPAGDVLRRRRPDLLVIDDPVASHAETWLRAARRLEIPVASVHDLGIAWIPSDLLIDGAFVHEREDGPRRLLGPRYMICALPAPASGRPAAATRPDRSGRTRQAAPPAVLIALGGGPRRAHALRMARAIQRQCPDVVIRIAGGFAGGARVEEPGVTWLSPLPSLASELRRAIVAVVAGGVTLYEACALGVPAVALAVTGMSAQRQTVRAGAALGVLADAGALTDPGATARAAEAVSRLLGDRISREKLASAARRTVDGRGASQVARHLGRLARKRQ
ncbi:MAG: glycosyltransferase [Vicinamibacterales bacterium]